MKQPDSDIQFEAEKSPAIAMPEAGKTEKAERMQREREVERDEGMVPEDRGSSAAPSDRPENRPPHPQDVNEIGE